MIAQTQKPMKEILEYLEGKEKVVLIGGGGCATVYAPWSKSRLNQYKKQIQECNAILMLTCGDGLQVVRELALEEEFKIIKPIYPGINPIGHMGGGPTLFKKNCQQCGECELGKFAGICPLTQCA